MSPWCWSPFMRDGWIQEFETPDALLAHLQRLIDHDDPAQPWLPGFNPRWNT